MNATPIDGMLNKKRGISTQHLIIAGGFFVVAIALGITALALKKQVATTQTIQTQAAMPDCLNGDVIPLPANPGCYEGDAPTTLSSNNWVSSPDCGAPLDGHCKKKNTSCAECRDSSGLRTICKCSPDTPIPSPTIPNKIATPTVFNCPKPGAVTNVVINCPTCLGK